MKSTKRGYAPLVKIAYSFILMNSIRPFHLPLQTTPVFLQNPLSNLFHMLQLYNLLIITPQISCNSRNRNSKIILRTLLQKFTVFLPLCLQCQTGVLFLYQWQQITQLNRLLGQTRIFFHRFSGKWRWRDGRIRKSLFMIFLKGRTKSLRLQNEDGSKGKYSLFWILLLTPWADEPIPFI